MTIVVLELEDTQTVISLFRQRVRIRDANVEAASSAILMDCSFRAV